MTIHADLFQKWIEVKAKERAYMIQRRKIENFLTQQLELAGTMPEAGSTRTIREEGFKARIIHRANKKVDWQKAQQIAHEMGCSSLLGDLFRINAEVRETYWKSEDPAITSALERAIEVTPARPTYQIEEVKK